jgi:TPR repeat protein
MVRSSIKLVGGQDLCPEYQAGEEAARDAFVAQCLAAAQDGDNEAFFDLGMAFSAGSEAIAVDLIEAHKWFNLAAVDGHDQAAQCRADIAEDMTAREIAEAQRRAREWLRASPARRVA